MSNFPATVIVVGAGVFGLSTALAIARRHPSTTVTVVDRLTPPVADGTSVDTTRCIRADYADPVYARLAAEAQKKIEQDPDLRRHYYKQGMSFVTDGQPGKWLDSWLASRAHAKEHHAPGTIVETETPEAVFQRIHGPDAVPVPDASLEGPRKWNRGYCNLEDAFIDAAECIRVYYERCVAEPSIRLRCGVAVERLQIEADGTATGVVLVDGQLLEADRTVVAAGAWSNGLLDLEGRAFSSAIEVAWIKLTEAEIAQWKHMSITTNLSTGFNLFPPHCGETKCLLRSAGYQNTVTIPHPEDPTRRRLTTSLPRTIVTHPGDVIPAVAEAGLRANLREIMPTLADRPFDRTKLCWISQTPSSNFIVAPHPHIRGVHVATGGSAHAWKFLTIIGDKVVDSIEGRLEKDLAEKWAWDQKDDDGKTSHRMAGHPQELRDVVRSGL